MRSRGVSDGELTSTSSQMLRWSQGGAERKEAQKRKETYIYVKHARRGLQISSNQEDQSTCPPAGAGHVRAGHRCQCRRRSAPRNCPCPDRLGKPCRTSRDGFYLDLWARGTSIGRADQSLSTQSHPGDRARWFLPGQCRISPGPNISPLTADTSAGGCVRSDAFSAGLCNQHPVCPPHRSAGKPWLWW